MIFHRDPNKQASEAYLSNNPKLDGCLPIHLSNIPVTIFSYVNLKSISRHVR